MPVRMQVPIGIAFAAVLAAVMVLALPGRADAGEPARRPVPASSFVPVEAPTGESAGWVGYTQEAGANPERAQSGEAGGVGAEAIFGTDDRERVDNTTNWPFSAIVHLEIYIDEDMRWSCSGTLIGPDVVLTTASCIHDFEQGWAESIAVIPGADEDYEPFGYQWGETFWISGDWIDVDGTDPLYNWGLIKLPDSTLGNSAGWMPIISLLDETLEAPDFYPTMVGFPDDKPWASMWLSMADAFTEVWPWELYNNLDSYDGYGGASIWSANVSREYWGYVAALHTWAYSDTNYATRVEGSLINAILSACEEIGCTAEAYEETPEPPDTGDTFTYDLSFRWSFVTWYGADGIAPEDALMAVGQAAGGDDIFDAVTAVYGWDPATQTWRGFFPEGVGIPGANDLTSLRHLEPYWIATNRPAGLFWTIASTGN